MINAKQKLELTWIGKESRPRLEPRILIEDTDKSYHAKHRVSENDLFDNLLIRGDNLLGLRSLESSFTGRVECVYVDPPFNTQQAFEFYDDGIEHSLWLSLIRDRFEIIKKLLTPSGSFFIHIDDNELGYLIALCDEIFGRQNRIAIITFKQGSATGHKAINPGCISTTNFLLWYCNNRSAWNPNKVYTVRDRNTRYNQFIKNRHKPCSEWKLVPLAQAFAEAHGVDPKKAKKVIPEYEKLLDEFVFKNAESIAQLARPSYDAVSKEARQLIDASKSDPDKILFLPRKDYSDMYFKRGERIIFFRDTLKEIDGQLMPGEPLTTLWDDIPSHNLHNEGFVDFPKGKKPEALIKRCFELATRPGDIVLDSFLGSGTSAAVAHKMGRRWIGIELGDHCETHCIPRLKKVIDGEDQGGISKAVNWQGGGGFQYYHLAPSLIKTDQWGNSVINPDFNAELLAEAVCKVEGFEYAPSQEYYWQHGKASEQDFIYVTTQTLARSQLEELSNAVGSDRSLLVCCAAFRVKEDSFSNLTLKKIPKAVLGRCEWDHDNYSLRISNLPDAPPNEDEQGQIELL